MADDKVRKGISITLNPDQDYVTPEAVVELFLKLTNFSKALKKQLEEKIETAKGQAAINLKAEIEKLAPQFAEIRSLAEQVRESLSSDARRRYDELAELLADIQNQIDTLPPPYDPTDVNQRLAAIDEEIRTLKLGDDVRNRLEVLDGDDRLRVSAISGLEELITDIVKRSLPAAGRTSAGWGAHPLTIAGSGSIKSKVTRHINFKGTGVSSVTRNPDGTVDVTINTGSGEGGITPWSTPPESVDGSTTVFTVDGEPNDVVADGITIFPGVGYTYAGGQITLTNAPQIYVRYR